MFYRIGVREKDWRLLCTGTSFGSFLYTVVPMGLTSSPSVMTRCMNALFITHIRSFYHAYHKEHMPEGKYVFCFIDDIILVTKYEKLHYKIIEVIFCICTQYRLTLKPGKCTTGYDCIEYLGNMMSGKATWPTPHRVKALVNMALPTAVTELQSFLGAMGFVRIFMPHYSQVSQVLERLTGCLTRHEAQRTPVQWTKAAVLAFLKIKHKLIHFCIQLHHRPRGASLHLCGLELNRHRSHAHARYKGCAIASRIHVEKLESDTDLLTNL